jgi:hypothetical protein
MTVDYTELKFNYKYKQKVVNKLEILNYYRHIKYSEEINRKWQFGELVENSRER